MATFGCSAMSGLLLWSTPVDRITTLDAAIVQRSSICLLMLRTVCPLRGAPKWTKVSDGIESGRSAAAARRESERSPRARRRSCYRGKPEEHRPSAWLDSTGGVPTGLTPRDVLEAEGPAAKPGSRRPPSVTPQSCSADCPIRRGATGTADRQSG